MFYKFFNKKKFKKNCNLKNYGTDINANAKYKFIWKISAVSLAVFLFYTVIPTYAFVDLDSITPYSDFSGVFEEKGLAEAETGFLLKPTVPDGGIGDRSRMSEVFDHKVEKGETLSSIAARYGISVKTIVWSNNIFNVNRLKIGQKITILPVDGVLHTVKKKETLSSISKKYKVEADIISRQNKLKDGVIVVGDKLIIPGAKIEVPRYIASRGGGGNRGRFLSQGTNFYSGNKLIKPTNGVYTQYFHTGHFAVDIANANAGPVYAAASGTVTKAQCGWNGGYGCMIIINHGNGMKTLYAHNSKLYVKPGDLVLQGQTISWMGHTGRVYGRTGIHLHFEVIVNGIKRNPLVYY